MKLDLFRMKYCTYSTPGKLSIDGVYFCETLELPWKDNAPDISCIPAGTYPVVVNFSKAHQKNMPEICDVPNRDGVRFDIANYPHELLGCVAVGKDAGVDCLNQSTAAWMDLYEKIDNAIKSGDTVALEVHAPPDV